MLTLQNLLIMANFSKISLHCPFKFVPNTATPGIHFDDNWACEQIKSFQRKAYYDQKWLRQTTTKIQCISTIAPDDLKIYDSSMTVAKSIAWVNVTGLSDYNIFEVDVDFSDIAAGKYWLYQKFELLSYTAEFISNPVLSKDTHPFVKVIEYTHSKNDWDMVWSTGISMKFCVECELMEMTPDAEISHYNDQTRDPFILDGVPFRTYSLEFFDARGGSPYMADIINRIFCCETVTIQDKLYARNNGAKLKMNNIKGYPLIGCSLEVTEGKNLYSVQYNDQTALAPGIVTAYNIETSWFAPGTQVPIVEIESP